MSCDLDNVHSLTNTKLLQKLFNNLSISNLVTLEVFDSTGNDIKVLSKTDDTVNLFDSTVFQGKNAIYLRINC